MRAAILAQPDDVRAMSQWTGPITIMVFFAQVGTVSLVLSIAMVMRKRTSETMLLTGANLALIAPSVLIYFRREDTFELIFAILIGLFLK